MDANSSNQLIGNQALIEQAYYLVGFVVVTSLSTLVAALIFIIRKIVWLSKLEYRVETLEKDVNSAFQKIREQDQFIKEDLKLFITGHVSSNKRRQYDE